MSVRLRLTRLGRKKRPFYRIVAADSRAPRDGKFLERIGTYNPLTKPAEVQINKEAALKWLKNGALPTDTVRNLFSNQGIMFEFDLIKRGLSAEQIELEYKKQEAVQAELLKKREALDAQIKRETEKKSDAGARTKAKEAAEVQPVVEAVAVDPPAKEQAVVEPPAEEPTEA